MTVQGFSYLFRYLSLQICPSLCSSIAFVHGLEQVAKKEWGQWQEMFFNAINISLLKFVGCGSLRTSLMKG